MFRVQENAEIVLACLFNYRDRAAYLLHEFVVMPNHLHILLTPGGECTLEKAMQSLRAEVLAPFI